VELVGGLFQDSVPSAFHLQHVPVFAALAGGETRVRPAAWTDHVRTGLWLAELNQATWRSVDGLLVVKGFGLLAAAPSTGSR
jgi:hypothetical protein